MCYLVAKKFDVSGCIALSVFGRKDVSQLLNSLNILYLAKGMQFIVLGNPDVYGEYRPYRFVDTEKEFLAEVKELADAPATILAS